MNNYLVSIAIAVIATLIFLYEWFRGGRSSSGQSEPVVESPTPDMNPLPAGPLDLSLQNWLGYDNIFSNSDTMPVENQLNAPKKVARWQPLAKQWARRRNLPWRIVLATIWQESWGDPGALSITGARGLMQLFPAAVNDARSNGYEIPDKWKTQPAANVQAGTAYLALQLSREGTIEKALEAYKEGEHGRLKHSVRAKTYADGVLDKAFELGYLGLA